MISLETAKKLKEAGLEWEPKINDEYRGQLLERLMQFDESYPVYGYRAKKVTLVPCLDQLLSEIEKRECVWELSVDEVDKPPYAICLSSTSKEIGQKWFQADSPEEATAQALIWILEQEVR